MDRYKQLRSDNLKLVKTTRPYLKISGYVYVGGYWKLHTICKDCGLDSCKPAIQLINFDCACKRGAKISKSAQASNKNVRDICKLANVKLIGEYTNMNTPVQVSCKLCNHVWNAYFGNLRKGHSCSKCGVVKQKATILERYGVESASAIPSVKKKRQKTMLARYGVKHALQNRELYEKNVNTSFGWKEVKLGRRTVYVQGYEPQAINWIRSKGIKSNQIVCGRGADVPTIRYDFEDQKNLVYFPDIWLPHLNRIVEVKSDYTLLASLDRNIAKRDAAIKAGYDFKFLVMDKNGNRLSPKTVARLLGQAGSK